MKYREQEQHKLMQKSEKNQHFPRALLRKVTIQQAIATSEQHPAVSNLPQLKHPQ